MIGHVNGLSLCFVRLEVNNRERRVGQPDAVEFPRQCAWERSGRMKQREFEARRASIDDEDEVLISFH